MISKLSGTDLPDRVLCFVMTWPGCAIQCHILHHTIQKMRTPLMVAASHDNVEAVRTLISNEDEIDAIDAVSGAMQRYIVWTVVIRMCDHCHETDCECTV